MNLEKNFSENSLAVCFQFSLGIRGDLTADENKLNRLNKYEKSFLKKGAKTSKLFDPLNADFFCYKKSCEYLRDLDLKEKTYQRMTEEFPIELDEFLYEIIKHKALLDMFRKKADCSIRIAVQADEAQIYFEFTSKQLSLLAEIGLRCEISVISWGLVADF